MSNLPKEHLEKLTGQLIRHEGTRRDSKGWHIPYRCKAGALTIGYGHNLDANPIGGMSAASRLHEDEAKLLLSEDIRKQERLLLRALPFVRDMEPVRYAVMVNMCFNLGIGKLLTFRNTLSDIENGQFTSAARRMLHSRWASQVGARAVELSRQMETGAWQ